MTKGYKLTLKDCLLNDYSVTSINAIVKIYSWDFLLKIMTETCPNKENNSVLHSSLAVQYSEWIHPIAAT